MGRCVLISGVMRIFKNRVVRKCSDDKYIENISFTGDSCSICKASASIMTDKIKGLSVIEFKGVFRILHLLITKDNITDLDKKKLGKLLVFSSIADFPMRVKCVTLGWYAVKSAIESKDNE